MLGSQAAPSAHCPWGVLCISWVTQTWQGLSTPLRRNLWQCVALSRELKRALLALVWVMVTVLGITLHSFPREWLFMGVSHPKFMCNPIFTHCIWVSALERTGEEGDTSVLALACSATFYHTEKRDNKKFPSVL